jgi:hypothetical protein
MTPPIAVEIKSSTAPKLTKGNWNARDDLAPRMTYVVHMGEDSYSIAENVQALPVSEVSRIVAET